MGSSAEAAPQPAVPLPWYRVLYVQVLIAIAVGILLGRFYPQTGVAMKPLGDGFIALIRMMIAPVIFCTVVHGIASMRDLGKVGRVGLKALVYFEVVSTIALGVGLLVGKLVQPGNGFNIDPAAIDPKAVANYVSRAKEEGIVQHLLSIIPDTPIQSLAVIVGIDRFMSECRALTNLIGNGVATNRGQPLGGRARPRHARCGAAPLRAGRGARHLSVRSPGPARGRGSSGKRRRGPWPARCRPPAGRTR